MKNYYEILEVNEKASQEIISKIFKIHIKKWHPDLYQGDEKIEAENKTKELNEAYSTLSDENKRAIYDEELALTKSSNVENYELETLKEENEMLRRDIERKDMIINNLINPSSDTAKKMHYYYNDLYEENVPENEEEDNNNNNNFKPDNKAPTKLDSLKYLLIKILLCFIMLLLGFIIIYLLIEGSSLLELFNLTHNTYF